MNKEVEVIHQYSDNSPDISRRSLLKGLAKGTAAGVLFPFLDFGQENAIIVINSNKSSPVTP